MASQFGRKTVAYKVNKSGGSVIAGDVVVPDPTNDNAFTTTTTAAVTTGAWVADETIANNATGRVVTSGHVTLINVSASVTRGHTGTTHTVAKQAVSTGGTTRIAGTFCKFTTGGTTPEADIWPVDLGAGSGELVASSAIWTTSGKVAVATGTGTATEQWPPGHEFDYTQKTSSTSITQTVAASADTVITAGAVSYDGSTVIMVEFYAVAMQAGSGNLSLNLWDGSTDLGRIAYTDPSSTFAPVRAARRLTPSNASHTYSVRGYVNGGTGSVPAGAGGTGATNMPCFIRQYKV